MKIREIEEEDIQALAKLNCSIFKDTDEGLAASVFSESYKNRVGGACLLAEDDGKIVVFPFS